MAHKTGYCETSLRNVLMANGINTHCVLPAFSDEMLAKSLNEAADITDLIFIVGGLSRNDESNITTVLSKGFKHLNPLPVAQKIPNPLKGSTGYILSYAKQHIVLLPDDPEQIASMLSKNVMEFLNKSHN